MFVEKAVNAAKDVGMGVAIVANRTAFLGMVVADSAAICAARGVGKIVAGEEGAYKGEEFARSHGFLRNFEF